MIGTQKKRVWCGALAKCNLRKFAMGIPSLFALALISYISYVFEVEFMTKVYEVSVNLHLRVAN